MKHLLLVFNAPFSVGEKLAGHQMAGRYHNKRGSLSSNLGSRPGRVFSVSVHREFPFTWLLTVAKEMGR